MNFFMVLILVNYNNCNTQHKEMTITLNNTMIRCNKYNIHNKFKIMIWLIIQDFFKTKNIKASSAVRKFAEMSNQYLHFHLEDLTLSV